MFFYLAQFKEIFSPLNILNYITFRAGGSILTAFFLMIFFGPRFIEYVKKNRVVQATREDRPSSHKSKANTPIMGGVLILMTTVFSTLLWARCDNRFVWLCLGTAVYLGALGFIDDYKKWKLPQEASKGITPTQKMMAQIFLAILVSSYLYFAPPNPEFTTKINLPYTKGFFLDLGVLYIFFSFMVLVGSSNAVNLTDGLDGLAIGAIIISCLTFIIFTYLAGNAKFSSYLRIVPVAGAGEISIFLAAVVGAGLGFLWFNAHPAEIFMGDTGSLFLGGALGLVALMIKQELILVVVGGLFVAEALSVLIQVFSFRKFGRRVFKMAPLHHHFELSGWAESKVTVRFWIVCVVLSLLALASLKLR